MTKFEHFCQMPATYDPSKIPAQFCIESKMDGIRCILKGQKFYVTEKDAIPVDQVLQQSTNLLLNLMPELRMLDGVFCVESEKDIDGKRFYVGQYHVFDALRGTSFQDHTKGYQLSRRKNLLKEAWLKCDSKRLVGLRLIDENQKAYDADPHRRIMAAAKKAYADGHEGVIVKNLEAYQKQGRSDTWMHVKSEDISK
jgi:ATP-dependent DNA ligase